MKKAIFAVLATTFATTVYALCTTHYIHRPDGSIMTCQTCCVGTVCNTRCW